jgi:predicted nucleotidyltransferase
MNQFVEHDGETGYELGVTKRELIAKHRDAILALAAKHGATNVRIFGSVARGDENEASDVDVVVRRLPTAPAFAMVDLQMDLEELLGCKVDLITEQKDMRPHFLAEVKRDAVPV